MGGPYAGEREREREGRGGGVKGERRSVWGLNKRFIV